MNKQVVLEEIRKRDAASAETWFKAPNNGPARAFQDRRWLLNYLDLMAAAPSELTDDYLRQVWRDNGGEFFGPNVEHGVMEEKKLLNLLRRIYTGLAAAHQAGEKLSAELESTPKEWCSGCTRPTKSEWVYCPSCGAQGRYNSLDPSFENASKESAHE